MPELETEKAIAARVRQAIFFLEMGQSDEGLKILKRLEKLLPEPEGRHVRADKGAATKRAETAY